VGKGSGGAAAARVTGWLLSTAMGVSGAAAAFGAPAFAEEFAADETPITVIGQRPDGALTNPRATAPMVDLPLTVSVVPEEVFEQQGARDLTTILENTPGITFNAGENGFATGLGNFSMRGFDTSANIFIDGVRDSGNYSRDAYNIAQVEIIKGPAGDNGRGGAGGYVNIVTKTPFEAPSYRVTGSYGWDEYDSDARRRVSLDMNQPFSADAAGRINVLWEEGGVVGRDVAQRDTWAVAPSIAIGLGGDSRFVVALQHVEQRNTPDWGVPAALISGMSAYDPTLVSGVSHDSLRDVFYGLNTDFDDVDSSVALLRFERTLSETFDFSSQVRWSDTSRRAAYTLPSNYAAATDLVTTQRQGYARDNESLSWLNNLSGDFAMGPMQHRVAMGVEITRETSGALAYPGETNPGGATQPLASPDPNRAGVFATAPSQESKVTLDTIAAYFYDTIEFSPQWELTGGLRAESYRVDIAANVIGGGPLGVDGYSVEETTLSGRLGLVYKPAEHASLYGAVGVASLPPGSFLSNSDISREGDNAFPGYSAGLNSEDADVQRSINYELGAKWNLFDQRLSLSAALFHTVRENVAITGRTGVLTTDPVSLQGYGEQIAEGFEISLIGQITDVWSIYAGALYMETERKHSAALDLYRCRANPGDYGLGSDPASCTAADRTSGDELSFSPNLTANVWTTYALPFGVTIGGGVRYVGESFVGRPDDAERIIANDSANMLPDYWVADAMLEYAVSPHATLRLNVDNITDEFYAVSTNWSVRRVLLGPSRSFLLSLALRL
jgi:catecholate siderophore receptor